MLDNVTLPIYEVIPEILDKLSVSSSLIIKASTGAGKSTVVPLELIGQPWICGRKIILVEPRRIAVRSVAFWMAKTLKERVGDRVGYRVHLDTKVSSKTIIEVVTEGVFLNKILGDPELLDTAIVIFDEFHERSIDVDLSLCLLKETQEVLRDDLKVIVMSATLDTKLLSNYLNGAHVVNSLGRSYPVDIIYNGTSSESLIQAVVSSVIESLNNYVGSILVFLPGVGEIKRVQKILDEKLPPDILICPLYGGLKRESQELAINPCGEIRKIVLSTSIAESSITIDGVTIVIDSGLIRQPMFNSKTGMDSLETVFVSTASADQRAGRAGRVEPGVCIRLWESYKKLDADIEPGINRGDLTSLVLNLASWGYVKSSDIDWLSRPNDTLFTNGINILTLLGSIDHGGITDKGNSVRRLPVHPRLGSMIYEGGKLGIFSTVAKLAAILSEKDFLHYPPGTFQSDINYRLDGLNGKGVYPGTINNFGQKNVLEYARSITSKKDVNTLSIGLLLMFAYPDRIAKNLGDGRFILFNGAEVNIEEYDTLYNENFIIVLSSGGIGKRKRVYLAHRLLEDEIYKEFSNNMLWYSQLIYDKTKTIFRLKKEYKLGSIVLKEERINKIPKEQYVSLLIPFLYKYGLSTLNWDKKCLEFKQRLIFLHNVEPCKYPDFSEEGLLKDLGWLKPYITTGSIDLLSALKGCFSWDQLKEIDNNSPTHIKVPSGSIIPLDYASGEPVLKVRLQEMFGLTETPKINKNSVAVTIHLLSPASRPIQITKDLTSFWDNTYIEVKKDLKGRYPKHHWPEDPYQAVPTNRIKRKK